MGNYRRSIAYTGSLLFLSVEKKKNGKISLSVIPLLLLAGASNFGCVISQKLYMSYGNGNISDFNLITFSICTLTLALIFFTVALPCKKSKCKKNDGSTNIKQLIVYIFVAIIMLYSSQYFNTAASGSLPSGIFFPLSYAVAMPLTFFTDIIIFKERIKISSFVGLFLVIISVILINI